MISTSTFFKASLLGISVAIWLLSCDTKTQQAAETTTVTIPDSNVAAPNRLPSTSQSELMQTIIGKPEGDFRGFVFGDPVSKIKSSETFEMFEDSTDHVGFTHETDNFEAIDVVYFLDNNQALNGIRVDVYLNDAKAAKSLWEQFDTYFSGKYTADKRVGQTAYWRRPDGRKVSLENVTKGKDFGIKLVMGTTPSDKLNI